MHVTEAGRRAGTFILAVAALSLTYAAVASFLFLRHGLPRHRAEAAWFIAGPLALLALGLRARSHNPVATNTQARYEAAALAGFIALAFVLYFPSLSTGLFSDDFVLLARARSGLLTMDGEMFRPLPMAIWRALSTAGINPVILHTVNALMHGLNSWLVFRIGTKLELGELWAFVAGLIFMASSASVEAVTWISALFDILMTTGALLFILGALTNRGHIAAIGLATALLSKETGVIAAFVAFVILLLERKPLRIAAIGIGATLAFVSARVIFLPPPESYFTPPTRYLLKELMSRSAGAIALPWRTADFANHPVLTMFPWVSLACLAVLAMKVRVDRRVPTIVLHSTVWILASVLPVYSYFFISETLEGSRYVYLGTAAFALLSTALASGASARVGPALPLGLVLPSIMAVATGAWLYQSSWRSAAMTRDAVLLSAYALFPTSGCEGVAVERLPDTQDGVYIFRNGFAEALAMSGVSTPILARASEHCSYTWDGRRFVELGQ